jgi:hypothetical protein
MDEEMNEAPIPPAKDNVYNPGEDPDEFHTQFDKFMGQGGDRVIDGIQDLLDSQYFDVDDIIAIIEKFPFTYSTME